MSIQAINTDLARYEDAKAVRGIYIPMTSFPEWVLDPVIWKEHRFTDTKVFYHASDSLQDVEALMKEREPCNIAMRRLYSEDRMMETFGYRVGAYARTTSERRMPNIAVLCRATVKLHRGYVKAHVVNLVGIALDSPNQPDFKYFHKRPKEDLIMAYRKMWALALAAAKTIPGLQKVALYNVGGGAFAGKYGMSFTKEIFEPAFSPLRPAFAAAGLTLDGYDWKNSSFIGGKIPDRLATDDLSSILYINAWDPWSLIGNGNEYDRSLDGAWGRISNMAVLGWRVTNPEMKFVAV